MKKKPESTLSLKSVPQIARELGLDQAHVWRVWKGERQGSYPIYLALREAQRPMCLDAIAFEKKAKRTHAKENR